MNLKDYTLCSRYNRTEKINGIAVIDRAQNLIQSSFFVANNPHFGDDWSRQPHIFDKIIGDIAKLYSCAGATNPHFVENVARELHDAFVVYFKIIKRQHPTAIWPPIFSVIGQIKYDDLLPFMKQKQIDYVKLLMDSPAVTRCN